MALIERVGRWSTQTKIVTALAIALTGVALYGFLAPEAEPEVVPERTMQAVTLISPAEYQGEESLSLIGTARAFNEAAITADRGGRITSVRVGLGDRVGAGQVIATLENSSEQAAVLQAEGAYEAALAGAEQSGVSVDEAQNAVQNARNSAVTTYKNAYTTVNGVIRNNIDTFFSQPDSSIPGLRVDGRGRTEYLNSERVAYQTLLPEWENRANALSRSSDLDTALTYAENNVRRTISLVDAFLYVFSNQSGQSRYSDAELNNFRTQFTNLRSQLISLQANIDASVTGIENAQDAVRRAELGASGGTTSAADAQIKQALGSLRSAQANLAKTILRTPISGTVNTVPVSTGDFVGAGTLVAEVANNNALEIVTYISDNERSLVSVGDQVTIDGEFTGTVTEIAPAVDATTRKTEVRIGTENIDIQNGDTVRITKQFEAENEAANDEIIVPLSAVKFNADNGIVFLVEDSRLVARDVELGTVRGSSVEVVAGLERTELIVEDARGLQAGAEVAIAI